jgi:two-component system KDP operon response regulator KdpE
MTNAANRILVVDDEAPVRRFLRHSLEANGFHVVEAETGELGLQKLAEFRAELVILDYGLPGISGLEALKRLREWSQVPVVFLTARDSEQDKVEALDAGADDYLTKPFSVPELLARVRVALRRVQNSQSNEPVFVTGPLEIDRSARVVRVAGSELKLTATEYELLTMLARHHGKVVPHRTILKEVWGPNSVEHHHYLRVYFGHLRKKLEAASDGAGKLIETQLNVGYRLV